MPGRIGLRLAAILVVLGGAIHALAQRDAPDALAEAFAALRNGRPDKASQLATEALARRDGQDRNALWVRAQAREQQEDYSNAIKDYLALSKLDPDEPRIHLHLGGASFKNGDTEAAIAAFDKAAELEPQLGPQLWQRGIAHYYARRFQDGAEQFETHRTVNPQDVENTVWHFLCVAASRGLEEARKGLLPINRDSRVPMMEVYALFRNEAEPDDVLAAAASHSGPGRLAEFYAHLYLGLYYEALRDGRRSEEHIARAADLKDVGNYMWHVARVHRTLRARDK